MIQDIIDSIQQSYANNSWLYQYFAKDAKLEEIVEFLYWDYQQPNFQAYVKRWYEKTPLALRPVLDNHIDEEQGHGELFDDMMQRLLPLVNIDTTTNSAQLERVNYTFSPVCAERENFGFFCGAFYATELMACKRYEQLLEGFKRLGFDEHQVWFITLHSQCESAHSTEALEELIKPLIADDTQQADDVFKGVNDRIQRSGQFIQWYENQKFHQLHR